jgi:hypothetical protein
MNRGLAACLLLVAGFCASHTAFARCPTAADLFSSPALVTASTSYKDYTVRIYSNKVCQKDAAKTVAGMEIRKAGKRIYKRIGRGFALGYYLQQDQPPDSVPMTPGLDISGEGQPELLVSEWSDRNAHCCLTFHLFRLGERFKEIQSIPLYDADESAFVRRDGVKGLVLNSYDYSAFAYFPFDFASSPAGHVLLSFQDGRFKLDLGHMKANAPTQDELDRCAARFKANSAWGDRADPQPMGLWYYATDLIYSGNSQAAWDLLDKGWGGNKKSELKYLSEYKRRFANSVYYPQLLALQASATAPANPKIDWDVQCRQYLGH